VDAGREVDAGWEADAEQERDTGQKNFSITVLPPPLDLPYRVRTLLPPPDLAATSRVTPALIVRSRTRPDGKQHERHTARHGGQEVDRRQVGELLYSVSPPPLDLAVASRPCSPPPSDVATTFRPCRCLQTLLPSPDLAYHRIQSLSPHPDLAATPRPCRCLQTLPPAREPALALMAYMLLAHTFMAHVDGTR
jgi:hypothetical protein